MEFAEETVAILYGSETGTAEGEARMFQLQCAERGIKTRISAFDEFPIEMLPEIKFCVMFVSTAGRRYFIIGQGDPPFNMTDFWSFILTKSLPSDSLVGLRYSVFGFGDSSYKKYNAMGRMLFQRLVQLGAEPFQDRGLGDDKAEGGYNLSLTKWKKELFPKLCAMLGASATDNQSYSSFMRPPRPIYSYEILSRELLKTSDHSSL